MIIIAEKLNGAIPSCAKAIAARDEAYIKDMAIKQAESGAAFLDVHASVKDNELEVLKWMIDCVQSVTDCPIAVDSSDVNVIIEALPFCKKPGMFNSINGASHKIDAAFPILAKPEYSKWHVMALLEGENSIAKTAAERIEVFESIMAKAKQYGIADDRIHIDPLIEMLCTTDDEEGISMVLEIMRHIKTNYPKVHISGAISNISFNLPARKFVNQAFAAVAIQAGMDSAVMDPLSEDLRAVIYAAEAMAGLDDFCAEYMAAYREGIFGAKK
ncbi:MAG: dihydropteroate synthase [Oscillospiraceae bacterium]|nr:dihydropteroate synthase [Oscillospiraceae bacterium]